MWGESEGGYYGQEALTWVQSSVIVLDGVLTGSPWLETPQATELIALNIGGNDLCLQNLIISASYQPVQALIHCCYLSESEREEGMNNKPRRLHMGVGPCNCLERNPQHKGCISFTSSESRKAHLPINSGSTTLQTGRTLKGPLAHSNRIRMQLKLISSSWQIEIVD
ncbi:hypothetical protein C4D60_Mb06t03290 [Musa balbisiana]|uniref:Uncharacterized protein n=1 Tax=Musa balbisiana TaxID=52838 RepID=A0A4V4H3M3_MUSBA|nr:hypothetical protein C4D60_Mb06t03290 [Musa balbisiana]